MDVLTNKRYAQYDYTNRYTSIPYYYHTVDKKDIYGIGENLLKTTSYFSYQINPGDSLDSLALTYYGNPTYWWVIAYFNDIQDSFESLFPRYSTIKIPQIAGITFGSLR